MFKGLSLAAAVTLASTLASAGTFEDTCQDPASNSTLR